MGLWEGIRVGVRVVRICVYMGNNGGMRMGVFIDIGEVIGLGF